MSNVAIILSGGVGQRYGWEKPKQFVKIAGKTILEHTLEIFNSNKNIDEIYIVSHPHYIDFTKQLVEKNHFNKVKKILGGGETRQESSRIGVYAIEKADKVLIHDAVRPFITHRIIDGVIKALDKYGAVDVAIPATDTIIEVENHIIVRIPPRKRFWRGQTPQGFRYEIIKKAHKLAEKEGFKDVTDDCGLVEHYSLSKIFVVVGDELNIKITFPHDIYLADRIFQIKNKIKFENLTKEEITKKLGLLKGKKIVIFGGTSGIGLEIYNIAKEYGAEVFAYSRRNGVDVSNYEDVLKVFEKLGKVDIVINTAGILYRTPIKDESISKIVDQIKVNLIGAFNVVKASIEHMKGIKSIILFTSSSYTRGREYYSPYSASKAGISNMVQALGSELNSIGIKINAISPARTKTPMRLKNFGKEPEETLLDPKTVAYITLISALSDTTGEIIDVRKEDEYILKKLLNY